MSKMAIITDTHWGCRNDNLYFADYFNKFYYEYFFPYLKENGITHIFHLGDIVDRRKYINYLTARNLKRFVETCHNKEIRLDVIVGNHDTYFKNQNDYNSMNELFSHSSYNINYYSSPTEVEVDGLKIAIQPWICSGNFKESIEFLDNTNAQILFGHLEIQGFEMYRGSVNDHGFESNMFDKFDMVLSGHFHHKSTRGNINYLGAPYEMTWSDYDDDRGFHIFDTNTRELTFIKNPYTMFNKVLYDDKEQDMDSVLNIDSNRYTGTYVKIIVRNKTNPYWFDMYIDKFEKAGVLDLQVVEDNFYLQLEDDSDIASDAEDTVTILKKYIDQLENVNIDKKRLDNFMHSLYNEAISME